VSSAWEDYEGCKKSVETSFHWNKIAHLAPRESPIGAIESSQAIHRLDLMTNLNALIPFGSTDHLS
jgi:hypothetical protein